MGRESGRIRVSCTPAPGADAQHLRIGVHRCRMYKYVDDEHRARPLGLHFASVHWQGFAHSKGEPAVDSECVLYQLSE